MFIYMVLQLFKFMRNKFYIILVCSIVAAGSLYLFGVNSSEKTSSCPFCDEHVRERQKFYEDDLVIAMMTHKPILPGHVLVIPKRHVERLELLTDEEVSHIFKTIKKVHQAVSKAFGTSSYLILQKNGTEVGQTVPHVHFHYIPRETGDTSTLKFLYHFYISSFKKPLSVDEMKPTIEHLQSSMPVD